MFSMTNVSRSLWRGVLKIATLTQILWWLPPNETCDDDVVARRAKPDTFDADDVAPRAQHDTFTADFVERPAQYNKFDTDFVERHAHH